MKSTKSPSHDMHLKMPHELHRKLQDAAAKLRRTLPDFIRLVLEDAIYSRPLPPGFKLSKAKLPGGTRDIEWKAAKNQ